MISNNWKNDIKLRLCRQDESELVGQILYDAFRNEALSKTINYSEYEQRAFWFEQGKVRPHEKLMVCATSSSNDADILGLAVIEPVSISEVNEDYIELNGIDPIYLLLIGLRRVFWQQLLQKYSSENNNLGTPGRYFRFSYLAVSPSAWGRGIASKLVEETPRFIEEFNNEKRPTQESPNPVKQSFFVYAETSSKRSQKIFGSHGYESWTSVRYEEHRRRYTELAATFEVPTTLKIGPCDEEEMLLQVRLFDATK